MSHFYLVTSLISYTKKDTNESIVKPFSCIVMGNEKIKKYTQKVLENLSIFVAGKFIEQSDINPNEIFDFDRNIMGINYLGEMTKEEFVDADEAVFQDLSGKEQIVIPTQQTAKPAKEQIN